MDLVAGVRKEGSRGGRADFKWEDVKDDAHRENYLGHSLMAPVGRWQQNRDLSWYARSSDPGSAAAAAEARREELRKVKEAEQDAMSAALGYGPMPKANANDTPIGKRDVEKALKEANEDDGEGYVGKGIGYGGFDGGKGAMRREEEGVERMGGFGMERREGLGGERRREKRRRSRSRERRYRRSRSRDRSRERRHARREDEREGHRPRRRSHERSRERHHRPHRERSRSDDSERDRRRDRDRYHDRDRSVSPYQRRRDYSSDRNHARWRR